MTTTIHRYKHIRDLREDSDITQEQMAQVLSCSQVAYSYYELAKRHNPTDILIKLADYYNVSIDYLLDQTNNKLRNF